MRPAAVVDVVRAVKRVMVLMALASTLGCVGRGPHPDRPVSPGESADTGPRVELQHANPSAEGEPSTLLVLLHEELQRAKRELDAKGDPAPYFLAYEVTELDTATISASFGSLEASERGKVRMLDVDVRVGTYDLDNTRIFRLGFGQHYGGMGGMSFGAELPIEDDPSAIKAELWSATHQEYRQALSMLAAAKSRQGVTVAAEDDSADFSREEAVDFIAPPRSLEIDMKAWQEKLRTWSTAFKRHAHVHGSHVELTAVVENRYFVSSEGTRVQTSSPHVRVMLVGTTKAEDGMDLQHADIIDVRDLGDVPAEEAVVKRIDALADQLKALREAPLADTFTGPAILEGRAAAVYFHEVFGHRVEGHRQKDESEGQTFTDKIGTKVMPEFIDVFDDPSLRSIDGVELNGHYFFDNEGVRGSKASLVEDGVFKGFLMSRSPTRGFDKSNGHGRRQAGMRVAARQGNLVVYPSRTVSREKLDAQLLQQIEAQGKPYGLRFVEISGGYTLTSRYMPQAFQVQPVIVYRVYPDGREELIRGATMEGTPLSSLSKLVAASDRFSVFNGVCGAESGYVPVSAASPDLLIEQIEVARAPKSQTKPPLLPPPPLTSKGGAR
jgi:TldD protein